MIIIMQKNVFMNKKAYVKEIVSKMCMSVLK